MVPHSLFVSSDRHVDFALNVLTLIVVGGLLATLAYLLFTWMRPMTAADRGDVGPPVWASMSELLAPPQLEFEFQVTALPTIYRCERRGEITYSDRPCKHGRVSAVSLRPF
jgi:hypothetical protein